MDEVAPGGVPAEDSEDETRLLLSIADALWSVFRQCLGTIGRPLRVDKCFIVLEHFTLLLTATMVEKVGGTRSEREENLQSTLGQMGKNVLTRYRDALDAAEADAEAERTTTEKQANAASTRTLQ